jgi:hypothetical protein
VDRDDAVGAAGVGRGIFAVKQVNYRSERKPKRKRGQTVQAIDFLTPLSVDECIQHLESGRFPLDRWSIKSLVVGDQFVVYLVNNYIMNHRSSRAIQNSCPLWIEGDLTEDANGLTRVKAAIQREQVYPAWAVRAFEVVITVSLAWMVRLFLIGDALGTGALFTAILIGTPYVLLKAEELRARRLARTLLPWLEDRLDVQRTK